MKIKSDSEKNPTLQAEMASMRGGMVNEANKNPLPERFIVRPSTESPSMIITDSTTRKVTEVSLYAYGNVRKALNDLFA